MSLSSTQRRKGAKAQRHFFGQGRTPKPFAPLRLCAFALKGSQGSTMIECIVAIGLYIVMLTLALQTYVLVYRNLETQQAKSNLLVASRELTHQFRSDARTARQVLPRWRRWRTDADTLILQIPSATGGGQTVVYNAEPERRQVTRYSFASGSSYSEPLGRGIGGVSFHIRRESGSRPLVEMRLIQRQVHHRRPVSLTLRTAVVMRNG